MEKGRRLGDYEVLDELGRGGMGRVYRVRNVISDRVEAMKVLLPGIVASEDLSERFLREIKVLAALEHPNIAALRTALSADGQVAMVMELVEGQSLAKRLTQGPIAAGEAIAHTRQVLAALRFAHEQGVIHRDVKPANMMVTDDGIVKLTDFGIARSASQPSLTVTGTTAGSVNYMSPEQVGGEAVDARSDLYSVGISLYEMVTGRVPFKATSEFGLMSAHVTAPPTPPIELQPDLPPDLDRIILRAIAKNPADRFQSADEFSAALASAGVARRPRAVPRAVREPADRLMTTAPASTIITPGARARATAPGPVAAGHPHAAALESGQEGKAHRLLYLVVGAALVIVAVAGGWSYLPGGERGADRATVPATGTTSPDSSGTSGPGQPEAAPPAPPRAPDPAAPAAGPAASEQASPTRSTSPVSRPPDIPVPVGAGSVARETGPPAREQPTAAVPGATAQPRGPSASSNELAQVERELDQLAVRAAAVHDSLDVLEQQQARQGLGLRGDIAARRRAMDLNLSRTQEAIARGDGSRARQSISQAQGDVEALETFLGR